MIGVGITCGFCGKTSSFDSWTWGQLKEHYKCPACKRTIRRNIGKGKTLPSGLYIPGKITIVEVTPQCGG